MLTSISDVSCGVRGKITITNNYSSIYYTTTLSSRCSSYRHILINNFLVPQDPSEAKVITNNTFILPIILP